MFWFSPVLSTSSAVAMSSNERADALQFFEASQQIGATNGGIMAVQQRQLLAVEAAEALAEVQAAAQAEFAAVREQATNSGGANGVSMLGGLLLTGSALLLSYARGTGLASAASRGAGGVGGGGGDASRDGGDEKRNKKDKQKAAVAAALAAPSATVSVAAGTTLAAAAVVALGRRGMIGGASSALRHYSSKRLAPMAAEAAVKRTNAAGAAETAQAAQQLRDKVAAAVDGNAGTMRYEVVPPHALKQDCGQAVPPVKAKLSAEELCALDDVTLVAMVRSGALAAHSLEKSLGDLERAVRVRRAVVASNDAVATALEKLPYENYDYSNVVGACAENVLGYIPVPIGVAGPVLMDGEMITIPMATTEGCLIASTHRGCKAITESGGAITVMHRDGMTRAPAVAMPSAARAGELLAWLDEEANQQLLRDAFQSTTRFGKLKSITAHIAGRTVYVRFCAQTGDAMGMNMISKGVEAAMSALQQVFPDADCLALSGNVCTDKKPSAINWINGRGKSVVAEAIIKKDIVEKVLKTSVDALCALNVSKNLVGSAVAGSLGGFNAHASNIVTAMYIATGQDPAQNVESSNCMTLMERDGEDLRISVTMPSIECASIGGGTHLPAQSAALGLMGCQGANADQPGANAQKFARAVAVATLAGELSLMSALCAGHLVRSHMHLNRKK